MEKHLDFRSYCDMMEIDYYRVIKDKEKYDIIYRIYKQYCSDNNYICEKRYNI